MAMSGCRLVEVGTTNRTSLADYKAAIDGETAAVLKVHRSNFEMTGFVEDVPVRSLHGLCKEHRIQLFEDLGSGAVSDLSVYGLPHERTLAEAVRDGADVVCVSGDKLLGGPQAGVLVGNREAITALANHPLYRALRLDKTSLAALEVCALAHLSGKVEEILPLYRLLATGEAQLRERAEGIVARAGSARLEVCVSEAVTGGGTLPGARIPSVAVAAAVPSVDRVTAALRRRTPPVLARVQDERVYFDLKTVFPDQDQELARAIADADSQ